MEEHFGFICSFVCYSIDIYPERKHSLKRLNLSLFGTCISSDKTGGRFFNIEHKMKGKDKQFKGKE